MNPAGERGLSPLKAFEAVMGFARRRGEPALNLALHAAVPQVLHIDLLHLLRLNFVTDTPHPGVTETDVLFASFCTDMGNGYFRFDDNARMQLLQQLDPGHHGPTPAPSLQVADFMLNYFERELFGRRADADPLYRGWLEIERWNALAFRDPEAAAEQLAAAVQNACAPGQTRARLRLGTLAASLATPLASQHRLLRYAAGMELAQTRPAEAAALLRLLGDEPLRVGSVSLPPAAQWLQGAAEPDLPPAQVSTVPPPLQTPLPPATPVAAPEAVPTAPAPAPVAQRNGSLSSGKPIADCEFTAFISYAHADDAAWFDWVTQFRNELERGLSAMLRGVRLPRMHMAGDIGPIAGVLNDEFKQRLASSFALIIIVHDNYAQSDWCLKELEHFKALYGDEGFRQRLYIVAMSAAAMHAVVNRPRWRHLIPADDQVWIRFYDPVDTARPLDIYLGPGLVAPAFRTPFEHLRADLAAKIKQSAAELRARPAKPEPVPPPVRAPRVRNANPQGWYPVGGPVLFGFVAPASEEATADAAATLSAQGVHALRLTPDAVAGAFADMADINHFVLAFDDEPTLMRDQAAGGHLEIQRDAWLKAGKPAECLYWLDLRPWPPPRPWKGGAGFVEGLGVATTDLTTLAEQVGDRFKAAPRMTPIVRVYVESNRNEPTLWQPLGEALRRRWQALLERRQPALGDSFDMRCRGLPIDQFDTLADLDDADGIMLLWGRKTAEALVAQINKVENMMSATRDVAPGIVACLMPPQPAAIEPVPAWGWPVLRFDARDEDKIDVLEDEAGELDRFLQKVFERARARRDGRLQ